MYLGVEVALVCLYALRLPIGVTWHFYHQDKAIREGKPFWTGIIVTIIITYSLGIAGGAALIAESKWGLPLVATSCVVLIVRTVLTAWALMFGLGAVGATPRRERGAGQVRIAPAGRYAPRESAGRRLSPSSRATITVQAASASTFTAVRAMSSMRSNTSSTPIASAAIRLRRE